MLPAMGHPDTDPEPPEPASSQLELPVPTSKDTATMAEGVVGPRGCPFLLAEGGGWRLDIPSREHRCTAVSPTAILSLEKQARLCLTASHPTCATYQASMSARAERLGIPSGDRATRWALARTTTVIEDAGGLRARVTALVLDRRRWPAVPAVLLVGTLFTLAISGLSGGTTPVSATPGPTRLTPDATATSRPTPLSTPSPAPEASSTTEPSAAPTSTPAATQVPTATFRTYKVKSGDTLSAIAADYGTTARAIAALNGITVTTTLHIGQVLNIPNPTPEPS